MRARGLLRVKSVMISFASAAVAFAAPSLFAAPQQSAEASAVTAPHISEPSETGVPKLIQFSGTLKDVACRPISGVASVTFVIYNEQDNGSALWSETQNVLADANGHYAVLLGAATGNGVPSDLFGTGESRWLGVTVARQPEMPRVLIASVPYALKAGDADTLGGLPASSYVTTQQFTASNARSASSFIGGNTTVVTTPGTAASAQSATTESAQSSVIQANPTGSGTTDYIPLWASGSNLGNSLLFQTGGKIGVGTTTPASTLDINGGEILRGGFYEYAQGTATASTGQPSHSFQWDASVFSSSTGTAVNEAFGFRALPVNNNTPNPTAKLDLFNGTGGPSGTLVDTGLSIDNGGIITFAPGQTFDGGSATFTSLNLPGAAPGGAQISLGGAPFLSTGGSSSSMYIGGGSNTGYQTSASGNVGIGFLSVANVTTGEQNTGVGVASLQNLQDGTFNTALGYFALDANQHGAANFAGGYFALSGATGTGNTAVGYLADTSLTTGNYNTAIGYYANVGTGTISNSTAIGNGATVNESDAIVLGNSILLNGLTPPPSVGIGTSTPRSNLEISSPIASSITTPGPILTLSNESTGTQNGVAIDFDPGNPTGTLPFARIEASGQSSGAELDFYTHQSGTGNGTLLKTMSIDSFGNVQVSGSLFVTGEVEKGSGTFKIDDPIDPANKYLSHSFVESPDMMNIYNGNIVTDATGVATVAMPAWFEALNADFRYQLTVLGQFAQAIVASEMQDGKFTIRTDKPNVKVSWQVTGIRHDPYAVANRTPVEESKPASEQGRYLHPDVYGAGPDQRVRNAQARATSTAASDASLSPSPEAAVTR
jgi:hypothetical protein